MQTYRLVLKCRLCGEQYHKTVTTYALHSFISTWIDHRNYHQCKPGYRSITGIADVLGYHRVLPIHTWKTPYPTWWRTCYLKLRNFTRGFPMTQELGSLSNLPTHLDDGSPIHLLPPYTIRLSIEVLQHPDLVAILKAGAKTENYDPELFYGTIGAYCGLVMDGAYQEQYLCEQLTKELYNKRVPLLVTTDYSAVIPVPVLQRADAGTFDAPVSVPEQPYPPA